MAEEASWYDRLDAAVGGILPFGVEPGTSKTELRQRAANGNGNGALPVAAARGRTMTSIATVYPDGTIVPKSMTPGGVAVFSRDITAARRVKRTLGKLKKLFPSKRMYYTGKKKCK